MRSVISNHGFGTNLRNRPILASMGGTGVFFLIYSTRTVWVATRTELRGAVMVSLNFVLTDEEAVHDGSNLQHSSATMILKQGCHAAVPTNKSPNANPTCGSPHPYKLDASPDHSAELLTIHNKFYSNTCREVLRIIRVGGCAAGLSVNVAAKISCH